MAKQHGCRNTSAIRNACQKYKAYLMDVNRYSNLKRTGIDWLNPTFKEFDVTPFISKANNNNPALLFNSNQHHMIINRYMRDFVIKMTVKFTGQEHGDYLNIMFNRAKVTGFNNNQLNINPLTNTNTTLFRSYARISDNQNYPQYTTKEKHFIVTGKQIGRAHV